MHLQATLYLHVCTYRISIEEQDRHSQERPEHAVVQDPRSIDTDEVKAKSPQEAHRDGIETKSSVNVYSCTVTERTN